MLLAVFAPAGRVVSEIAQAHRKAVLTEDDVLDALVAAVTARLSENFRTLPAVPEQDGHGLRMEMVYVERRS